MASGAFKLHSSAQIFTVSLLVEQEDGDSETQGSDRPVRKQLEKSTASAQRPELKGNKDKGCAGEAQRRESTAAGAGRAGASFLTRARPPLQRPGSPFFFFSNRDHQVPKAAMNAVTTEHRSVSPVSLLSTAPAGARPLLRSPRPLPTVEAQECVPRDTGAVRVTLPGLGRQLEQPSLYPTAHAQPPRSRL